MYHDLYMTILKVRAYSMEVKIYPVLGFSADAGIVAG